MTLALGPVETADTATAMEIHLTHIGGPTVLIDVGGWRLLTDPTFDPPGQSYRFGWGTGSRKLTGPALAASEIGPINAVLLSHDHHEDNSTRQAVDCCPRRARSSQPSLERGASGMTLAVSSPGRRHGSRHRDGRRSRSPRLRAVTAHR
jgi:hypothetical protein